MSSSLKPFGVKTLAWAALAAMGLSAVSAVAAPVCPAGPNGALKDFTVYDGAPADKADLRADKGTQTSGYFIVDGIFDKGRFITVRCRYTDGKVEDVRISKKVRRCTYSTQKSTGLSVDCR